MRLKDYPYVLVRFACRDCPRMGRYRLAVLAERFGSSVDMREVLYAVSITCERWQETHPDRQCQIFLPDIPPTKPPDLPTPLRFDRFKVVRGGKP